MPATKPDITLSDGRELTVDLRLITRLEYEQMFDKDHPIEDEEAVVARVVGLTLEEFKACSLYDYKLIFTNFFRICKEPLADPFLPSASTTD